jgi:hypothetical protein
VEENEFHIQNFIKENKKYLENLILSQITIGHESDESFVTINCAVVNVDRKNDAKLSIEN